MSGDEAGAAGGALRRRVDALVVKETGSLAHGHLVSLAVHAAVDGLGCAMYELASRIPGPMAERVPSQRLALRLIHEAVAMTEEDFAATMAKSLESRS